MELLIYCFRNLYKSIIYIIKNIISFKYFKAFLTYLSIGFVAITIYINFDSILKEELNKEVIYFLSLGCIFSIVSIIVNGIAWKELIKWLGNEKHNVNIIYLFLRTNSLKYLPGGIWHFLERFRVLSSSITPEQAFTSVLLEPFLMMSAALFLLPITDLKNISLLIFFIPSILLARRFRGSLLLQLGAIKIMQFKKFGEKIDFGKESFRAINPSSAFPFNSFILEILFILLRFAAFWCCLNAFLIHDNISISRWIFLFSSAWTIGLLVPSAPGGIGIFESFILLTLGQSIPTESLLLVLIYYRLLASIADLFIPFILILKRTFERLIK